MRAITRRADSNGARSSGEKLDGLRIAPITSNAADAAIERNTRNGLSIEHEKRSPSTPKRRAMSSIFKETSDGRNRRRN
jgi:hypothetical protein